MLDQVAGRSRATHPCFVYAGTLLSEPLEQPSWQSLSTEARGEPGTGFATSLILIAQAGQSNKVAQIVGRLLPDPPGRAKGGESATRFRG
jgi:hypothetical protein